MTLVNLETFYSFPNLSDENNVYRYSPGFTEVRREDEDGSRQRQWVGVQIPENSYEITDISATIKFLMERNGHDGENIKITANTSTLKSVLEISNDFQVDFRAQNSIQAFLDSNSGLQRGHSRVGECCQYFEHQFNSREC